MTYEQIVQKTGKRIIPRIYYYENGTEISLDRDDFQQAKFKFNASLVGTIMYGVELEVKSLLPDTLVFIEITARYDNYTQTKVYGGYLRRGEPTYNADTKTYTYEMYDKIITAMVDYQPIDISYPTTVYDFFKELVSSLNFTTEIAELPNGTKTLESDIYKDINYTYRDVLNDIGQATGTLFHIDGDEIKEATFGTSEITIDDDILKNQNITLGKHFGPINTIVLTRSSESDSIYYPKTLPNNPIEFRIADNQLMNENNREEYLEAIFNQLSGIEFDIYDTALVGYGGFEPLSKIKITTGGKEYNSYVFNNEITISQGYEEVIYTEEPTETSTDYKASDTTDRRINQVYIIARKLEKEIEAVIDTTKEIEKEINPIKDESGSSIIIEDASNNPLTYLEIEGKSTQEVRSGKNKLNNIATSTTTNGLNITINKDKSITINGTANATTNFKFTNSITLPSGTYTLSGCPDGGSWETYRITSYNGQYYDLGSNKTFTITESLTQDWYIQIYSGATLNNVTFYPMLNDGSTALPYESYGVAPSPDYPSEIESVGYENLFDINDTTPHTLSQTDGYTLTTNNSISLSNYIRIEPNQTYKAQCTIQGFIYRAFFYDENKNYIGTNTFRETMSFDAYYVRLQMNKEYANANFQLEKGSIVHPYISYGKYGVEVETIGRNIAKKVIYASGSADWYTLASVTDTKIIKGQTYTISVYLEVGADTKAYWNGSPGYITYKAFDVSKGVNRYSYTFTALKDGTDIGIVLSKFNTGDGVTIIPSKLQLEGPELTDYEEFQLKSNLLVLNAPLRSLPNGVKDIAYIKNGRLYADRYVGSVVLDGSESWELTATYTNNTRFILQDELLILGKTTNLISNYFVEGTGGTDTTNIDTHGGSGKLMITIPTSIASSVNNFKTWLSTHNTQVGYELATPVTEEYGEIEMLKTLKGYNNISTTDELLPIINLTYVRDTVIADYVENHVTELKLTENEIKASVESVSSSVDGLNTTINRVEEITNDNSQVINVISTNIDKTSGEVREVTTTTGFTFNAEGMTIDDGSGFKAQHRANGTYYKDGTKVTGQYTKDGSKQKDLQLFGIYSYGMKDIDDTPMFIGQLYNDANGEECFGHFYNGGE